MRQLDIMFLAQDLQLKQPVQQGPINQALVKHLAQMHQLDIMFLAQDLQLKPPVQRELTNQALVNHRVLTQMQVTM